MQNQFHGLSYFVLFSVRVAVTRFCHSKLSLGCICHHGIRQISFGVIGAGCLLFHSFKFYESTHFAKGSCFQDGFASFKLVLRPLSLDVEVTGHVRVSNFIPTLLDELFQHLTGKFSREILIQCVLFHFRGPIRFSV